MPQQEVQGRFHGLVEGEGGDIFTLKVLINTAKKSIKLGAILHMFGHTFKCCSWLPAIDLQFRGKTLSSYLWAQKRNAGVKTGGGDMTRGTTPGGT